MKYDFSKIKTEELREAKKSRKDVCGGIICSKCPFYGAVCDTGNNDMIYDEFCKELIRREKMENKMPELEAGMILEFCTNPIDKMLYINDEWLMSLKNDGWADFKGSLTKKHVNKIYKCNHYIKGYYHCLDNLELIWSKKSDKDIKIEELEKELQHLEEDHSKKVSEIRDRLQELKG